MSEKSRIVEKRWKHSGLICKVIFVRQSHRCGYVAVPKGHIAFGVDYDDIDVKIHGGLTYGQIGENKNLYWFGFDFAHAGDRTSSWGEGHFWTLQEAIEETNKLAEQLAMLKESQILGYGITEFLRSHSEEKIIELKKELE